MRRNEFDSVIRKLLHRRIRIQLEVIENAWPALPQAAAMPERLPITIEAFCQANKDGRGLKVEARQLVERTLKHIQSAERKAAAAHSGSRVLARKARKLLTSLQHNDQFELTIEQARCFRGEMQKEGRRTARRAPVCEPEEFGCGTLSGVGEIRLNRVVSIADLMKAGRTLDLCVAHADEVGRQYHEALKNGATEFWTLTTSGGPIALLSIEEDEDTRRVSEFQGCNGERPRATDENGGNRVLSGPLLRNVLRKLHADASDQEHFTRVGAFRSLVPYAARESYRAVMANGRDYRVWRFRDEVIVGLLRKLAGGSYRVVQWSRFVRCEESSQARRTKQYELQKGAWHLGAMDVDRFLELLLQSRALYDAVRSHPGKRPRGKRRLARGAVSAPVGR